MSLDKLAAVFPMGLLEQEGVKTSDHRNRRGTVGSALSFATSKFSIKCKVYMVRVSFDQKPYRKSIMPTFGANVVASSSSESNIGRPILEKMATAIISIHLQNPGRLLHLEEQLLNSFEQSILFSGKINASTKTSSPYLRHPQRLPDRRGADRH